MASHGCAPTSSPLNVPPLSSGRIRKPEGHQVAMSEPVVLHHGREGGGAGHDEARPTASTACWAAYSLGRVKASFNSVMNSGDP
jgi:hypothetical protein